MEKFFGEVPGYPVGTTFASRAALSEARVHRPTQGGTSGNSREGADSMWCPAATKMTWTLALS
jgi:putative restriction endonuclease